MISATRSSGWLASTENCQHLRMAVIGFVEKTGKTAAEINKLNLELADLRVKDTKAKEDMNSAKVEMAGVKHPL